jgi:hypothetical protein
MAYVGKKLHRGDPGFLGDLFGIGKGIAGALIPGVGVVDRAIKALKDPPPKPQGSIRPAAGRRGTKFIGTVQKRAGVSMAHIQDGTVIQRDDTPATACPQGMHPNKSSYFRTSPGGTVIFHPPGTNCVKNRRRNPLNPRAFDRALGRVSSAKRFGEKLGRVTIRKKCSCGSTRRRKPKD